ncbi:hypothetical protein AAFF_G00278850 [Aldrovandia affinis]|uniref:Uncharacterized protein n=1 Tax=Aldrovandia affinis TaxID=143900 RepID=A0AAD7SRL0_9TELE|nr:hypothetical protein AAFF_G00278850 [Aldrovandia affinis]
MRSAHKVNHRNGEFPRVDSTRASQRTAGTRVGTYLLERPRVVVLCWCSYAKLSSQEGTSCLASTKMSRRSLVMLLFLSLKKDVASPKGTQRRTRFGDGTNEKLRRATVAERTPRSGGLVKSAAHRGFRRGRYDRCDGRTPRCHWAGRS